MGAEAKHTPGLWQFVTDRHYGDEGAFVDVYGHEVCSFGTFGPYERWPGTPPSKADALLIAAAPDMLEALEQSAEGWASALDLGFIPPQHRTTVETLRNNARAAIAKATGGDDAAR